MDGDSPAAPRTRMPSYAALVLAAGSIVILLWFLEKIVTAILLIFFALVVAIALMAPVGWLVRRKLRPRLAAGLVLLAFFGSVGLIGWLVIPQLAAQSVLLVNSLPQLIGRADAQIAGLLVRHPELQGLFHGSGGAVASLGTSAGGLFRGVGTFSLGLVGVLALTILFLTTIIYTLLDPLPLLRGYIGSLPHAYRRQGVRALRRARESVVGWTKASLIIGALDSVGAFIFLSFMHVPAALVWAALAFFAQFIPRIGGYVMAFPPVMVALTISPMTALWVALFYLAMNELLDDVLAPRIRGRTMQVHPVLLIFFTLAFAVAFGFLGALVATPAAAFFSAFYSEFYIKRDRPAQARRSGR